MNCESTCKRKRDFTSEQDLFTVCASINVFCGDKRHNICSNRLYQYQTDFSWEEVYHDLIEDEEHFSDHKTDVVSVTVANTLQCTSISLTPDFYEKICVVKNFDPTLKYVTFKVKRDEGVGMQLESNEKERATSVNDFLMKASAEKKQASLKDPNTARFTGNILKGSLNARKCSCGA